MSPGTSFECDLECTISPAMSVHTIEGDPPEIEEDRDFYEEDDLQSTPF